MSMSDLCHAWANHAGLGQAYGQQSAMSLQRVIEQQMRAQQYNDAVAQRQRAEEPDPVLLLLEDV